MASINFLFSDEKSGFVGMDATKFAPNLHFFLHDYVSAIELSIACTIACDIMKSKNDKDAYKCDFLQTRGDASATLRDRKA